MNCHHILANFFQVLIRRERIEAPLNSRGNHLYFISFLISINHVFGTDTIFFPKCPLNKYIFPFVIESILDKHKINTKINIVISSLMLLILYPIIINQY